MPENITEGTNTANNIHSDNLVKIVSITEWDALQNTLNLLKVQVSMLAGSIQITNKQEEK